VDEHPVDAAEREVREETGLECSVVGFIGIWMDGYGPGGPGLPDVSTLNIYYHAELDGPDVARPDPAEVAEVKWFGPDELPRPEDTAFPSQQVPVLQAWRQAMAGGLARRTEMVDRLPAARPRPGPA
jgi:8-oxo-dGTP pyrophosphatase MutT (NUDIX family)